MNWELSSVKKKRLSPRRLTYSINSFRRGVSFPGQSGKVDTMIREFYVNWKIGVTLNWKESSNYFYQFLTIKTKPLFETCNVRPDSSHDWGRSGYPGVFPLPSSSEYFPVPLPDPLVRPKRQNAPVEKRPLWWPSSVTTSVTSTLPVVGVSQIKKRKLKRKNNYIF